MVLLIILTILPHSFIFSNIFNPRKFIPQTKENSNNEGHKLKADQEVINDAKMNVDNSYKTRLEKSLEKVKQFSKWRTESVGKIVNEANSFIDNEHSLIKMEEKKKEGDKLERQKKAEEIRQKIEQVERQFGLAQVQVLLAQPGRIQPERWAGVGDAQREMPSLWDGSLMAEEEKKGEEKKEEEKKEEEKKKEEKKEEEKKNENSKKEGVSKKPAEKKSEEEAKNGLTKKPAEKPKNQNKKSMINRGLRFLPPQNNGPRSPLQQNPNMATGPMSGPHSNQVQNFKGIQLNPAYQGAFKRLTGDNYSMISSILKNMDKNDFMTISNGIENENKIDKTTKRRIENVMESIKQLRFQLQKGVQQDEQRKDRIVKAVFKKISSDADKRTNSMSSASHGDIGRKLNTEMKSLKRVVDTANHKKDKQENMMERGSTKGSLNRVNVKNSGAVNEKSSIGSQGVVNANQNQNEYGGNQSENGNAEYGSQQGFNGQNGFQYKQNGGPEKYNNASEDQFPPNQQNQYLQIPENEIPPNQIGENPSNQAGRYSQTLGPELQPLLNQVGQYPQTLGLESSVNQAGQYPQTLGPENNIQYMPNGYDQNQFGYPSEQAGYPTNEGENYDNEDYNDEQNGEEGNEQYDNKNYEGNGDEQYDQENDGDETQEKQNNSKTGSDYNKAGEKSKVQKVPGVKGNSSAKPSTGMPPSKGPVVKNSVKSKANLPSKGSQGNIKGGNGDDTTTETLYQYKDKSGKMITSSKPPPKDQYQQSSVEYQNIGPGGKIIGKGNGAPPSKLAQEEKKYQKLLAQDPVLGPRCIILAQKDY